MKHTCPICEGPAEEKEDIRPFQTEAGMMIPIPYKRLICAHCGLDYAETEQLNFNAKAYSDATREDFFIRARKANALLTGDEGTVFAGPTKQEPK